MLRTGRAASSDQVSSACGRAASAPRTDARPSALRADRPSRGAADHVLTCSAWMTEQLARHGIAATYLPWPSPPVPPGFRRRPAPSPRFLYLGRLAPEKGVDVLLGAFATVVEDVPDARLRIVGSGPLEGLEGRGLIVSASRRPSISSVTRIVCRSTPSSKAHGRSWRPRSGPSRSGSSRSRRSRAAFPSSPPRAEDSTRPSASRRRGSSYRPVTRPRSPTLCSRWRHDGRFRITNRTLERPPRSSGVTTSATTSTASERSSARRSTPERREGRPSAR